MKWLVVLVALVSAACAECSEGEMRCSAPTHCADGAPQRCGIIEVCQKTFGGDIRWYTFDDCSAYDPSYGQRVCVQSGNVFSCYH